MEGKNSSISINSKIINILLWPNMWLTQHDCWLRIFCPVVNWYFPSQKNSPISSLKLTCKPFRDPVFNNSFFFAGCYTSLGPLCPSQFSLQTFHMTPLPFLIVVFCCCHFPLWTYPSFPFLCSKSYLLCRHQAKHQFLGPGRFIVFRSSLVVPARNELSFIFMV